MNLPKMSCLEFIQQLLIQTGQYIGNDFSIKSLEDFKTNLTNGTIYNWSGRISNVRNSKYQFNSNAKKNWIKFNNSDKTNYVSKEYIAVQDETLAVERDLYKIDFDLAEKATSGISEFTLYKQTVKETKNDANEKVKAFTNERLEVNR